MKILIITIGTRGDVQPYVALGVALRAAGHTVTVCTCSRFEEFVTGHGLGYAYLNNELIDLLNTDFGRGLMENMTSVPKALATYVKMARQAGPMQRRIIGETWEAARTTAPDLIVYHPKAFGAPHFAEKLGIPAAMGLVVPMLVPTRTAPNMGFPDWRLGGRYNYGTTALVKNFMTMGVRPYVEEWRRSHGLPPIPRGVDVLHTAAGEPIPILHGFSRHVVEPPDDWPESVRTTGYWFLDDANGWTPPPELERFLQAGEPPVYVGFGSMSGRNPERLTSVVLGALREAGVRGVLATGWGGLARTEVPESVLPIEHAPHDWLFPRVAAVVHHGGAGSTAAGLRAGRPTVVCPFFGDQPFWGRRVAALGVGRGPLPQKTLTVPALAAAIREVISDPGIGGRAAELGRKICAEDGLGNAVAILESIATARRT